MAELKREAVKMVRDFIKKDYKAKDCCYICGSIEKLELHHLFSLSQLFNTWIDRNKIRLNNTVEQLKELRVVFAQDNTEALGNDNLFTLCDKHHKQLHNLYGQKYSNHLVSKIRNWLETQKAKNGN